MSRDRPIHRSLSVSGSQRPSFKTDTPPCEFNSPPIQEVGEPTTRPKNYDTAAAIPVINYWEHPGLDRARSYSGPPAFEDLPYDIRICVYKDTLISIDPIQIGPKDNVKWDTHILPGLLSTNSFIHDEAAPILYGSNTFHIDCADYALLWLQKIGKHNVKLIKRLNLEPELCRGYRTLANTHKKLADWIKLFAALAAKATSLAHITLFFDTDPIWKHIFLPREGTFATNITFLRALSDLKHLRSFELYGLYPSIWTEYLSRKLGIRILIGKDDEHIGCSRAAATTLWPKKKIEAFGAELTEMGLEDQTKGDIFLEVRHPCLGRW